MSVSKNSTKKTKSVQVRLTEYEWDLIRDLTDNNPSEYIRQLLLKRLNKKLTVKLVYTFYSKEDVISYVLDNFAQNYGDDYPELTNPNNITVKQYKNGNNKIVWSGKIPKELLSELIRMEHHAEALYDDLPIEYSHVEVRYNKNTL